MIAAGVVSGGVASAWAQEMVGAELSAAVPSVVMGSTAARATRLELRTGAAPAAWLVCDPSGSDCKGLRPHGIAMNVFPHWDLHLLLPHGFSLRGHIWTMTYEATELTLRQGIVGTTLRHQTQSRWIELGLGAAQRMRSLVNEDEALMSDAADGGPDGGAYGSDRFGAAVLAGVGAWVHVGDHMVFDLRLRGGVGIGDGAAGVYHANFVVAFGWR